MLDVVVLLKLQCAHESPMELQVFYSEMWSEISNKLPDDVCPTCLLSMFAHVVFHGDLKLCC
jgi:hypothetical protein